MIPFFRIRSDLDIRCNEYDIKDIKDESDENIWSSSSLESSLFHFLFRHSHLCRVTDPTYNETAQAPKGRNNKAQGNALGTHHKTTQP